MQGIFEDERRGSGAFSSRPEGIGPKSALTALRLFESALHFLRVRALLRQVLAPTVIHSQFVHAA